MKMIQFVSSPVPKPHLTSGYSLKEPTKLIIIIYMQREDIPYWETLLIANKPGFVARGPKK